MAQKEAKARLKINDLLREAGWRFFDEGNQPANVVVELNVKMSPKQVDAMGDNFDKIKNGFVDFLLLDDNGKPFIVLEAKSEDKNPLIGKEQARKYAKSLYVKYVILSNGNLHYFWDIERGNPQVITAFPSYESLKESKAFSANPMKLYNEEVGRNYIAITQFPKYEKDPKYINEDTRSEFIEENGLRFLRPYQLRAIKALQEAAQKGNTRFLFEMATGTGKTLTSAAIIKLFLRTGNAKRILFLVDRIELENQAKKNFVEYLKNDYRTVIFKENIEDWRKAEIVVSTVQTLLSNNKFRRFFKPVDFDLIISDEAHRSINGNSRAVFEYFLGYKLGLTATPKDYIKNVDVDELQTTDPRAWERRQLLDTYKTFGCESGEPTFRYSLLDGVKEGYLVNPIVVDARTEITTKLLSDEGYAVMVKPANEEDGDEAEEETFFAKDFEHKFFSETTNKIFCKTFLENAKRDPITGEIGKTIIFCISRNHAAKIVQELNELAHIIFPGKYNSDFAMQITSDITNAQLYTINFQNNNLSGTTGFLEGYKSSKTRVCVTVGMMTTGYDCQDILNVVLMRPIFSPTNFVQIKGRGTRKYSFRYQEKIGGDVETIIKEKDGFKLFDFFGNCEYFEEKFNYDEVIELPKGTTRSLSGPNPGVTHETYENIMPDPLQFLKETPIGLEGMKIDRKLYEKFEEQVRNDDFAKEQYEQGNYGAVEKYIIEKIFDKPEDYLNLEKLRRLINIDRRVTLREIIDKIFGAIPAFKTKRQLVEDEFEGFCLTHNIDPDQFYDFKNFFETYLTDKQFRRIIEDQDYQMLSTCSSYSLKELKRLGKENMWTIINYIHDNVNINKFAS